MEHPEMEHPGTDAHARLPFEDEARVIEDRALMHDDITVVQTEASAAARVSGEHVQGMLYSATPRYPFDPHSSPGGVRYYPSLGDAEAEQR